MAPDLFHHIFLNQPPELEPFTSIPSGGRDRKIPERDRQTHSEFLTIKLTQAWSEAENEQAVTYVTRNGVYLEFKSDPGFELVTKSLEDRRFKRKPGAVAQYPRSCSACGQRSNRKS